jgi:uncharacterized membrane protein
VKEIGVVLVILTALLIAAPFFGMALSGVFIPVLLVGISAFFLWFGWKWLSCWRGKKDDA